MLGIGGHSKQVERWVSAAVHIRQTKLNSLGFQRGSAHSERCIVAAVDRVKLAIGLERQQAVGVAGGLRGGRRGLILEAACPAGEEACMHCWAPCAL